MLQLKTRVAASGMKSSHSQMVVARPAAPVIARQGSVRPTVARALLWPREGLNQDPIDVIIQVVLTWIEDNTAPAPQG